MNKYIAVIQARMGSTRFPGKVMQPIGEYKTVIEFLVNRLRFSKKINEIVLAIPFYPPNDVLEIEANRLGISCQRGEEEDIIKRVLRIFYEGIDFGVSMQFLKLKYSFDDKPIIIDITSDCPFVCPYQIDYGIELYEKYNCDYVSNIITRSWPDGFDFQIYDPFLLWNLYFPAVIPSKNHLTHTGWNILQYNDRLANRFQRTLKMLNIGADEFCFHPEWAITLDTKEDLEVINKIHKIISNVKTVHSLNDNNYSALTIIQTIHLHNNLLHINKNIKRNTPGV